MAAGDAARVIRAPGRLVVGPTDLGTNYPHGGTEVGKVRLVVVRSLGTSFRVESEGLGEATDVLKAGHRYVFSCFLRGWDDDAIALLWPDNLLAGSVSGHSTLRVPGDATPGQSATDRERVILFEPDDPVHAPSVLIYRGIPDWADGAELLFQRGDELGLPLAVECLRDDSDRILAIGRYSDLTL